VSAAGFISGLLVVVGVIRQVAALAIGSKVRRVAVLGRVIEVGNRENNARGGVATLFPGAGCVCALRPGVGAVIPPNPVRDSALFASIPGTVQNGGADVGPVGGVAGAVFGFDGHEQTPGPSVARSGLQG